MTMRLVDAVNNRCSLPPEREEGNVEYKLLLHPDQPDRLEHYVSQLKWRLTDHGTCTYILGVGDDGQVAGVDRTVHSATLATLALMVDRVRGSIVSLEEYAVGEGRFVAEATISISPDHAAGGHASDIKVVVAGPQQSGKSTLIGVLSSGTLDNGLGSARTPLLHHRHELLSGKTHSRSYTFLYFPQKADAKPEGCTFSALTSTESFMEPCTIQEQQGRLSAWRTVHLVDTPALPGPTAYAVLTVDPRPDACFLVIRKGDGGQAAEAASHIEEYRGLCERLHIPLFTIYTHCDWDCDCNDGNESGDDCCICVSLTTGHNLDRIFNVLKRIQPRALEDSTQADRLLVIEQVYCGDEVGLLVSGLSRAHIACRQTVYINPAGIPCQLTSIHRLRLSVKDARPWEYVTLALSPESHLSSPVDRGMFVSRSPCTTAPLRTTIGIAIRSVLRNRAPAATPPQHQCGTLMVNGSKYPCVLAAHTVTLHQPVFVGDGALMIFVSEGLLLLLAAVVKLAD